VNKLADVVELGRKPQIIADDARANEKTSSAFFQTQQAQDTAEHAASTDR